MRILLTMLAVLLAHGMALGQQVSGYQLMELRVASSAGGEPLLGAGRAIDGDMGTYFSGRSGEGCFITVQVAGGNDGDGDYTEAHGNFLEVTFYALNDVTEWRVEVGGTGGNWKTVGEGKGNVLGYKQFSLSGRKVKNIRISATLGGERRVADSGDQAVRDWLGGQRRGRVSQVFV